MKKITISQLRCIVQRALMLVVGLSFAAVSNAQSNYGDSDLLYVYSSSSNEPTKFIIDDLDKITFGDNGVNLWITSDWSIDYPYSKVNVISFKNRNGNVTSISSTIPTTDNQISIGYDASASSISVRSTVALDAVTIYSIQGMAVYTNNHRSQSYDISVSSLPRGVYIVKARGKNAASTRKIIRQ